MFLTNTYTFNTPADKHYKATLEFMGVFYPVLLDAKSQEEAEKIINESPKVDKAIIIKNQLIKDDALGELIDFKDRYIQNGNLPIKVVTPVHEVEKGQS